MIKRLYIVEKPSVARALAAALPGKVMEGKKDAGFIQMSDGSKVTFMFGHLIENERPAAYEEIKGKEGRALLDALPILPETLKSRPKYDMNKSGEIAKGKDGKPKIIQQYFNVERLIKEATEIVNAGDIDREGQLIIDEMLMACGVDPAGRSKPVLRLSLVSMEPGDIRQALARLENNSDPKWVRRRMAASARQICDWWLGMNMSMAYQVLTGMRTMSIGRVQTPVVGMVVARDLAIEHFKPLDYYVPIVTLKDGTELRWNRRADSAGTPGFDAEGRIIDKKIAQAIVDQIQRGLAGSITRSEAKEKSEAPPLPFAMGQLLVTVGKRHGLDLDEIKNAAQKLYETHKMISYVGTDCQFLPESMHADAQKVMNGISGAFRKAVAGANPGLRSRAFNDKKVQEHYAIVPTGTMRSGLTEAEQIVFDTISKRYIAQFHPDFQYTALAIEAKFGNDEFKATAREVTQHGWKDVEADSDGEVGDRETGGEKDQNVNAEKAESLA